MTPMRDIITVRLVTNVRMGFCVEVSFKCINLTEQEQVTPAMVENRLNIYGHKSMEMVTYRSLETSFFIEFETEAKMNGLIEIINNQEFIQGLLPSQSLARPMPNH